MSPVAKDLRRAGARVKFYAKLNLETFRLVVCLHVLAHNYKNTIANFVRGSIDLGFEPSP